MNVLRAESVAKRYPEFQLGPLTFELAAGAVHGLLGPNGAGKTTLLGSLAGHLRHDGIVYWGGEKVIRTDLNLRERIAYVPETPHFYDALTVRQTLRFCRRIFRQWSPAAAREWQERMGLPDRRNVQALSKGMRAKLALLIGISHRAELLLLDEPASGLDVESRREFHAYLKYMAGELGACIILSSHILEDLEELVAGVLILRNGEVRFNGRRDEIERWRVYTVAADLVRGHEDRCSVAVVGPRTEDRVDIMLPRTTTVPDDLRARLERAPSRTASLRDIYLANASPDSGTAHTPHTSGLTDRGRHEKAV